MPAQVDEETPLLPSSKGSPIPWSQFSIILLLQLAEPLSSHIIYPFAPELIRSIGITHGNESHVGYYVGLLQSLFFLAEAMGVLCWGRMSDRIGRKPVILLGLAGLSISSLCFGLSTTFWSLVLSRCLSGALNGNAAVMKTVMSEMTDRSNLPQLWGFLPFSWCVGVTFAPVIGGYLSRPADRFPELFGQNTFLKTYPYFLPCAFPAAFSAISWIITSCYLRETHKSPVSVYQLLKGRNDPKPMLGTRSSVGLRAILIPRVMIAVGNYACIALVEVAFRAIQPLFFATPIELGGLGLPPPKIGNILSISGALCGIIQVCFFARIHDRLGSKRTVIWGLVLSLPLFLTFPLASILVRSFGFGAFLWVTVGAQAILSVGYGLSFGAIFIYITAAAPSQASLGATHGLSQMTTSIMRAIGPATANGLFSLSIEQKYLGGYLVYHALFMIACIVLSATSLLPRRVWGQ